MQQPATSGPPTPNEMYRHVRRIYVGYVFTSMLLLFLALITAGNNIGRGILPTLLLLAGAGLLVMGLMVRASARCPRCGTSLMWKSGPIGMGHVSLTVKPKCLSCGLDLNQPWEPPPAPPKTGEAAAAEAPTLLPGKGPPP